MIGTEGETNTGKSEFILSCPGPGIFLAIDRGFDGMLDNPTPPITRHPNFSILELDFPAQHTVKHEEFITTYTNYRDNFLYKALANADALTVGIDCDSDAWELQRLAEFGKLTGIYPPTKYTPVYAMKKAQITRMWDSGKIIVGTNKLKDEYVPIFNPDGSPQMDGNEQKRQKSGNKERQGYPDTDYLWQIQLRHLMRPPYVNSITKQIIPTQWGIKILKCKHNPNMIGEELWGPSCNFAGLVSKIYPDVPLEDWGL